ncbi:Hypp6646 [Branchiostoma lanceolatum]|nr:Hypp6646 [Branchiostoma lanceolatum]
MPHLPCGSTAVWGPPLPPKPGKAIRQVVLWGGLDKGRWCCSNDLIKVDLTMTPKTTTAKVCILPGEKQDSVPSSRTGHILVAISSTQAILFGGLELSSRHKRFGTCAQSCRDGYFYSLDMPTLCWQKLPLPPLVPRAYHSSTWIPASSTIVIVGGITYSGHCPSERLSISDVVCLKIYDGQYTLTEAHMEGVPDSYVSSASASALCDDRFVVYGGYRHDKSGLHRPESSSNMYILDLRTRKAVVHHAPSKMASAGHTCQRLNDSTVVLIGGTCKSVNCCSNL